MPLKRLVRDGIGSISRRGFVFRRDRSASSASAVDAGFDPDGIYDGDDDDDGDQSSWASLPPELLRDVVERVEASECAWPARRHVVACAAVCRSWRYVCKEIVGMPEISAKLTFPVSLKQVYRE